MMFLIIGGAGSGKSAFAEDLLVNLSGNKMSRVYIATMEPYGEEAAARIRKHREARARKNFITCERYVNLAGLTDEDFIKSAADKNLNLNLDLNSAILLECLGNLCANELYSANGAGENTEDAIWRGILNLYAKCKILIIVSNEIFCGGKDYQGDTERYLRILARLNRKIAALSDGVCEISCGVPVWYKLNENLDKNLIKI